MAKDLNVVHLAGVIGDDYKYGKTSEGKEYATFSLSINSVDKEYGDSTERSHSQTFIRLFINDKKQIEYLRKIGAHRGMRAYVYGRLSSYKKEYKGNNIISLSVVCRDISIVQIKEDDTTEKKEQ